MANVIMLLLQVSTAISNQSNECDSLLESSTKCMTNAKQWSELMSRLHADLVKTRKSIAVEIDELFR